MFNKNYIPPNIIFVNVSEETMRNYKPKTLLVVTPEFSPPETIGHHLHESIEKALLHNTTHIAIVDKDVEVPEQFFSLQDVYPEADIIGTRVVPSNMIHRIWELSYHIAFKQRIRGCAVIYSTDFLRRMGGFPDVITPDTWLQQRAKKMVLSDVYVIHHQNLSLRHSVEIQIRDGKSRYQLKYSFIKTVLHSIFRLRPFVLYGYLVSRTAQTVDGDLHHNINNNAIHRPLSPTPKSLQISDRESCPRCGRILWERREDHDWECRNCGFIALDQ